MHTTSNIKNSTRQQKEEIHKSSKMSADVAFDGETEEHHLFYGVV